MMKSLLLLVTSLLLPCVSCAEETTPILILNMSNQEILPKNFRTAKASFGRFFSKMPSGEGLKELSLSGSGQFSQLSWQAIIQTLRHEGPILDVDLRQESHGFLNGAAISLYVPFNWINRNKSNTDAHLHEMTWLEKLKEMKVVTLEDVKEKNSMGILKSYPVRMNVKSVLSEEQMVGETKAKYLRLYVSDHMAPLPSEVDTFVQAIQALPKNGWVHIHCKAGEGRTTTFMAMYDMIHNAKKVSFEDIIRRQSLIGGLDLFKSYPPNHWKSSYAKARIAFLRNFYLYVRNNRDDFRTSWSAFSQEQPALTLRAGRSGNSLCAEKCRWHQIASLCHPHLTLY